MAIRPTVKVEGLAELRRDLRRMDRTGDLKELRDGLKAASGIVAQDAQARVPARSGKARRSIRPRAGGNRAYVVGGKARVPYYGWLDFGSRNPVSGQPRSVGPWANSGKGPKGGRFIYPAIEAKEREVTEAVRDALDRALRKVDL